MSSFRDHLAEVVEAHEDLREVATWLETLRLEADTLSMESFFEPVSIVDVVRKKRELLDVRAEDLVSWTRHIAFGMRCRMEVLEGPIVFHLTRGPMLAAMVLLRSHVEAAALAAHCLAELTKAAQAQAFQTLKELIPKTLFGTALNKHSGKEIVAGLLTFCEGDTVRICQALESLDTFVFAEHAEGKLPIAYSLLCEFAHPNHRGVMDFMVAGERDGGWSIQYGPDESPAPKLLAGALETLLVSMRGGYAAAELLRSWRFAQVGTEVVYQRPSVDDGARVWQRLLQRPADGAV